MKFLSYTCKKCGKAFIAEDFSNCKTRPPKWMFCEECCKKYNLTNTITPPKRKLSEKQLEVLRKNQFSKRRKSSTSDDNTSLDNKPYKGGNNGF